MRTERYTYLDLVRGLSAFAVLIVHYRWFYSQGLADFATSFQRPLPLGAVLGPIYIHGGLAVQTFWALSGVIFFIKYVEQGPRIDVRKFAVWRFARLYPLHLATLLLVAAIQLYSLSRFGAPQVYGDNTARQFLLHLFMAAQWFNPGELSFNAPIWSVSIELLIYALFVAYVRFARPALWKTVVASGVMAVAFYVTNNMVLLCGSLFFVGGAIVQVLRLARPLMGRWLAPASFIGGLSGICLAVISPHAVVLYFVAIPAVMLIALTLDAHATPIRAGTWLGNITYSTYLMHMPILMLAKMWLDQQPNRFEILASPITLMVWLGTVAVVGVLVFLYFELPAQKWIQDRFHAGRARNAIDREEMRAI